MKTIGESFRFTREKIGLTREETARDLEITEAQLNNLEDGNVNAFKDVFFLKELVKKYSKYLNLNEDEIMEEFNDFVFNLTSKIPISEIEMRTRELKKEELAEASNRISSPYTVKNDIKRKINPIIIYILSAIILVVVVLFIVNIIQNKVEEKKLYNFEYSLVERSLNEYTE